MNKKCFVDIARQQRGVSLVTLVITIIVIFILSAVTVNMLAGDGGVLKQSREAQNTTKNQVNEQDADVDALLDKVGEEFKSAWQDSSRC